MNVTSKFEKYQNENGWGCFYRCPALNEKGVVCPSNIKWICEHFDGLASIKSQGRPSYLTEHDGVMPSLCTNRTEEMIAMAIANAINEGRCPFSDMSFSRCEYQVPMKKDNKSGKGVGKGIDLVGIDTKSKTAVIMELKKPPRFRDGVKITQQNEESILRCLLEAYTYAKWVDNESFRCGFGVKHISICPVVFTFSRAHSEWLSRKDNGLDKLVKTIEKTGIKVLFEHLNYSRYGFRPVLIEK